MRALWLVAATIAFLAGCAPHEATLPGAFTPIPTFTRLPLVAPAITATALEAFVPFSIRTTADNVVLRSSPGRLFPQISVLPEGAMLLVLGRSPGNEWALAQTQENRVGWISIPFVDAPGTGWARVPLVQPASVQGITGSVRDEAGIPISGIQFSLVHGGGSEAPRNDAITDDTGTFYAFMPLETSGAWYIGFSAVSCTSNTMDANCHCKAPVCGKPYPAGLSLLLPLPAGQVLHFSWR